MIDEQRALFEAFIKLIATAIDEKSPYTGGHRKRLPELTMMIAEACDAENCGPLADFRMQDKDRYELMIAGWLQDCPLTVAWLSLDGPWWFIERGPKPGVRLATALRGTNWFLDDRM